MRLAQVRRLLGRAGKDLEIRVVTPQQLAEITGVDGLRRLLDDDDGAGDDVDGDHVYGEFADLDMDDTDDMTGGGEDATEHSETDAVADDVDADVGEDDGDGVAGVAGTDAERIDDRLRAAVDSHGAGNGDGHAMGDEEGVPHGGAGVDDVVNAAPGGGGGAAEGGVDDDLADVRDTFIEELQELLGNNVKVEILTSADATNAQLKKLFDSSAGDGAEDDYGDSTYAEDTDDDGGADGWDSSDDDDVDSAYDEDRPQQGGAKTKNLQDTPGPEVLELLREFQQQVVEAREQQSAQTAKVWAGRMR